MEVLDGHPDGIVFSEREVEQVCHRASEILAPNTALPASVIQTAVRQAIEETVLGKAAYPAGSDRGRLHQQQLVRESPRGCDSGQAQQAEERGHRNLELVFVHDCRNHGCNSQACVLCKHNPAKRCTGNFAHKYWVGDKLLAKCEGSILVELIDTDTGDRVDDEVQGMRIEVCILDGNKYTSRCREAGEQRLEILDECEVLRNQRNEPLLVASNANNDAEYPRVVLKFPSGIASVSLRDMKVTESSESVLAGTKRPPFRLVCRALAPSGARLPIRPAVSEEFVVVTKRTKNLKKQEIPSLDDPISKLNHIGKETVKKLNELKASADEAALQLPIPSELYRITKVRDFQHLARLSEADGHLQQRIKQLLKLSKEKWDAACDHAKTAVQVDNRMRAWYQKDMSVGLLYTCSLGEVRPDCPVALIQNRGEGEVDSMKVIPCEHQLPQQREQVAEVAEAATRCWWEDQHPGWMIFTLGNQHFESLEQILRYAQTSGGGADLVNPADREVSLDATQSDNKGLGQDLDDMIQPGDRRNSRDVNAGRRAEAESGANGETYNPLAVLGGMEASGLFRQYMKGRNSGEGLAAQQPADSRPPSGSRQQQPPAEPERNPFDLMTQQPFLGERPQLEGSVPRPLPESSITAALNWQVQDLQQWNTPVPDGSFSAGLPIPLGPLLSGGSFLGNNSLGSFNLSGLSNFASTNSLGLLLPNEDARKHLSPTKTPEPGASEHPNKRMKPDPGEGDAPADQE